MELDSFVDPFHITGSWLGFFLLRLRRSLCHLSGIRMRPLSYFLVSYCQWPINVKFLHEIHGFFFYCRFFICIFPSNIYPDKPRRRWVSEIVSFIGSLTTCISLLLCQSSLSMVETFILSSTRFGELKWLCLRSIDRYLWFRSCLGSVCAELGAS
jgi:hypothetical protein